MAGNRTAEQSRSLSAPAGPLTCAFMVCRRKGRDAGVTIYLPERIDGGPSGRMRAWTPAQGTLRLPAASPQYQVDSQVTWGYIKVGRPRSARSSRHVTARLTSSEPELLP